VISDWYTQSTENLIEVALMTVDNQPHPYIIDNKQRNSPEGRQLVFREGTAQNTLRFRLTEDDFDNGFKT
jgi:hypothetical protein